MPGRTDGPRYNPAVDDHNASVRRTGAGVLSSDSSLEIEAIQIALWNKMSPLDKARRVSELTRAVQELSLAGIRQRHTEASERECMLRLAALKLGPALAHRAYPEFTVLLGS